MKGEKDIRVYFNAQKDEHSQMPGQERKGISVQLSQITTKKLEDRGGESDLEVRDSGLKGERSYSLLSTSSLHVLQSSDQGLIQKD